MAFKPNRKVENIYMHDIDIVNSSKSKVYFNVLSLGQFF